MSLKARLNCSNEDLFGLQNVLELLNVPNANFDNVCKLILDLAKERQEFRPKGESLNF